MTTFLQTVDKYPNTVAASVDANILCRRENLNNDTLTTLLDGIRLAGKTRFVVHGTKTGRIQTAEPNEGAKPRVNGCPCCHGGMHDEFPI